MSSMLMGNFSLATSNSNVFNGTLLNDVLITSQSNQSIWLGGASGAPNVLSIGSNVTTTSNLTVSGLTTLSNLTVSGTVTGFNGVSSNQSFSNVYSSNITASNATFSNIGVGTRAPAYPLDVVGNISCTGNIAANNLGMFRNRIINGDMRINQRGATSIPSTIPAASNFLVDRWGCVTNNTMTFSTVTLTSSDTPFQYGHKTSIRTTSPIITAGYVSPMQNIEGTNMSDFMWGTDYGAPAQLSFWCRVNFPSGATLLPVRVSSVTNAFSYLTNVPIVSNSAWQYVNITIPKPPTSSAWSTTYANAYSVSIGVFGGAAATTTTFNAWTAGANLYPSFTNNNIYSTNGSYVEFTGVQFEKGSIATPFEFRPYAMELQLCQRYYQPIPPNTLVGYFGGNLVIFLGLMLPVVMRDNPVLSNFFISVSGIGNLGITGNTVTSTSAVGLTYSGTLSVSAGSSPSAGMACSIGNISNGSAAIPLSAEL